ncbi:hypothetical protein KEJ24_00045 [Candidatus Bathyarchaeota archaeon]|nr:hypothetical protein [Candidatus Bathyarchaeota archaeon]
MNETKSYENDEKIGNVKEFKEELGYPHELLTLSFKKAEDVLKGSYRNRTKIFAALCLSMRSQQVDLEVDVKNEPYLLALLYLHKRSRLRLRKISRGLNDKIKEYVEQFENTKSTSAFSALKNLVVDCTYLHLVSLEILKVPILSAETIELCMKYLGSEVEIGTVLSSLRLLEEKEANRTEIKKIINSFLYIKEPSLVESTLLISFLLALRFPDLKSELLFAHYYTLRKLAEVYEKIKEYHQLDDPILQKLFATSIVLFLCGYYKSLRLPHEEKLNYIRETIKEPFIEHEVEKSLDYASKVKILHFELPLWFMTLCIITLLLLHVFIEVYTPASIGIGIISFDLPRIPLFLVFSIVLLIVLFYKALKFKEDTLNRIRKGERDE